MRTIISGGEGITMAEEYGNYSPVARKAPHSIDIYFIDLETRESKKLTNYNAYSLSAFNLIEGGNWLVFRIMDKVSGLYKLNLKLPFRYCSHESC